MSKHPSPVDTSTFPLPSGLPENVKPYRQSPVFDRDTLPEALKRDHSTKAGVWAVIHVLEGSLRYRIADQTVEEILTPQNPGLVKPQQVHAVRANAPVRFMVEFHAADDAGEPHT